MNNSVFALKVDEKLLDKYKKLLPYQKALVLHEIREALKKSLKK